MTRRRKSISIYAIMIVVFSVLIFFALKYGINLNKSILPTHNATQLNAFSMFKHIIYDNFTSPMMILLMQIIVVLLVCRIFSTLFSYINQPGVIGEIIGGIILGPSFLGYFFPETFHFLFAKDSLENIHLISQLGLILFMFIIGLEVDFKVLKNKINETLVISHAGILVPFFLGILLSFYVYQEYASTTTSFLPFALFIGISMSITAFPILARIVQERGLTYTPTGVLSIASAANDDVTAWCLLAVVIAIVKAGTFVSSLYAIGGTILYMLFMFLVARPLLKKLSTSFANQETINKGFVSFIFLILIVSATTTELIGIHALFGAFIAGVIMPPNINFRHFMIEKIEDITLTFFLPLFFAYSGLNTNVLLINSVNMWWICLIFIIVAILGKLGGCSITARLIGETWQDSLTIGILMNTRGLMQLIALDIGYEMGILPKSIFAILIIMALVTTFMATPALNLVSHFFKKKKTTDTGKERLLLSFARPESGRILLSAYHLLFGNNLVQKKIIATHYTYGSELNMVTAEHYAHDSFVPIIEEAKHLHIKIDKRYKITENMTNEIIKLAQEEKIDYLLIGAGYRSIIDDPEQPHKKNKIKSILSNLKHKSFNFPNILIAQRTQEILHQVHCTIMILISHHYYLGNVPNVSILINSIEDYELLNYISDILQSSERVRIYQQKDMNNIVGSARVNNILVSDPTRVSLHQYSHLNELKFTSSSEYLIISSYQVCKMMIRIQKSSTSLPSYLAIRFAEENKESDK